MSAYVVTTILLIGVGTLTVVWVLTLIKAIRSKAYVWVVGMILFGPIASIGYCLARQRMPSPTQTTPALNTKGVGLAVTGFILNTIFVVLEYMATPSVGLAAWVASLEPFYGLLEVAVLLSAIVVAVGCYIVLKGRHRSLGWLVLTVPAVFGWSVVPLIILFLPEIPSTGSGSPLRIADSPSQAQI